MDLCLSGNFKNKSIVAAASAFPVTGMSWKSPIHPSSKAHVKKGTLLCDLIRLEEYRVDPELLTEKCDTGQDFLN
jgi:hypothetical protein